jgi:hypothetical protein
MGKPSRVRVRGPLEPFACGFRRELARQGYTPHSASNQLQLMAHASRWLACRGLGVGELTPARVQEFLADRRAEGYTLWLSPKAMAPVLAYLRGLGVVPTPSPVEPATPAGAWRRAPCAATCTLPGSSSPRAHLGVSSNWNA